MMRPSPQIVREYGIPKSVLDEAYRKNPVHRERTLEALAKVRRLCVELGIVTPTTRTLWRAFGIWPSAAAPSAA